MARAPPSRRLAGYDMQLQFAGLMPEHWDGQHAGVDVSIWACFFAGRRAGASKATTRTRGGSLIERLVPADIQG